MSTDTDALLIYDTETSGLPLWSEPSDDPRQPHIVQLAAAIVDPLSLKILSSIDVIVRPEAWTIPEEVANLHGITTEKAKDLGVSESMALGMLLEFWHDGARARVAHNESFDARIVRIALKRYEDDGLADRWKEAPAICTALLSQSLVQAPATQRMLNAGRSHYKKPTLAEAYRHFTRKELPNAHTAMGDVMGVIEVYKGIVAAKAGL